ncbi:MAG: hypothetical protein ACP5UC_01610 [Candidatus Micrarchaeia archaeon]
MKYVREHIKRYWAFSYRRAIGISMLTFSLALAIGMAFTSMLSTSFYSNYIAELAFWLLLILITVAVLVSSFVNAHISVVRFMDEVEHKEHSRHTAIWLTSIVVGTVAFFVPILFFNSMIEPLIFLFSFGGVLWVFYLSVYVIFKHHYNEIAFGALSLWIIFLFGMLSLYSSMTSVPVYMNVQQSSELLRFSLFLSMASLITIFGIIGASLLFNSSRYIMDEFRQLLESSQPKRKAYAGKNSNSSKAPSPKRTRR